MMPYFMYGFKDAVFEIEQKIIVYKDKDNFNNRAENLALVERTTAIYEAFKNDTRARKPAKPEKIYNQVGVHQYDLQGNLIHEFSSVTEAANAFKTQPCHLRSVLTNQVKHYKGFVFRYETDKYEGEYAGYSISKSKKVSQYTPEGTFIKTYETLTEAFLETGVNTSEISACALQKQKFGNGFVWRYEGDIYEGGFTKRRLKVAVHQYEKNGTFIQEFETITAAAKSLNVDSATIHSCLSGKTNTSCGYVWRYKDHPYHGEHKDSQRGIPVAQIDQSGKILATFITIRAAGKATGISHNSIQKNVSGVSHSSGGFTWRAATQEEIAQMDIYVAPPNHSRITHRIGVCQYTREGEKLATFDSITAASKATGLGKQTIHNHINNINHVSGKFIWRKESEIYKGELRDKFGKNEAKIVTQYDLEGNKVSVYPSTYAAQQAMNTKLSGICQAATGKLKTAMGFIWQYGDGPNKIEVKPREFARSKTVSCYDLEGNKQGFYKSLGEAARLNDSYYLGISYVVNGKIKTASERIWIYGDGPEKIDTELYFMKGEIKAIPENLAEKV